MTVVKLNSKNQIVLPREARDAMGVSPGDELLVVPRGRTVVVTPKPKNLLKELAGSGKGVFGSGYLKKERASWTRRIGIVAIALLAGCSAGCRSKAAPGAFSKAAVELGNAVNQNNAPAIREWLKKGMSPDIIFLDGGTVLHTAAGMGHTESVKVLLEGGANPNIARKDGRTPLHFAAQYKTRGQLDIVSLLLHAGANPNVKDTYGKTPGDYAVADNNGECAELLERSATRPAAN
jgi:AbrB family looped-hinge helix DNA binding protein